MATTILLGKGGLEIPDSSNTYNDFTSTSSSNDDDKNNKKKTNEENGDNPKKAAWQTACFTTWVTLILQLATTVSYFSTIMGDQYFEETAWRVISSFEAGSSKYQKKNKKKNKHKIQLYCYLLFIFAISTERK